MSNRRKLTFLVLIIAFGLLLQYNFGDGFLLAYAEGGETQTEAVQAEVDASAVNESDPAEETVTADMADNEAGPAEQEIGGTEGESYPAVTLSRVVDGVKVILKAPEGALPEGTDLSVNRVDRQDVFDAVEKKLEAEGKTMTDAVAFDVTPVDASGNEIQPRNEVTVTFRGTDLEAGDDEVNVFRVSDNAKKVIEMETSVATADKQKFNTDHFTIYVAGGSPENPHGDGSVKYNTDDHPYVLPYGETLDLDSNESSWLYEDWSIYSTNNTSALTVLDDDNGIFKNTNRYNQDVLLRICHKYADLGFFDITGSDFFCILAQRQKVNADFYLQDAGKSNFEKCGDTQTIWIEEDADRYIHYPKLPKTKVVDGVLYTLDGWYEDEACTKPSSLGTRDKSSGHLDSYAKYTKMSGTYAIVYDGNGEGVTFVPGHSSSRNNTSVVTVGAQDAKRPGYVMVGWSADPNATESDEKYRTAADIDLATDPNTNKETGILTLYAVWRVKAEISYVVPNQQFYWGKVSNGIDWITDAQTEAKGSTAIPADGYRFVEWQDKTGAVVSTEPTFVPERAAQNGKLYVSNEYTAFFEPITYKVTFETFGSDEIEPQTVGYNEKATKPADPSRGGCYQFGGWYKDMAFTTEFDFDEVIEADTTVYAKWIANHDWGKTSYTWNDDDSQVTAKRTCKTDPSHVETETVNVTSKVTKAPTCENKGERTYTAVFENKDFETQTKTEEIDAYGHNWGETTYEWSADNKSVTAKRVCRRDPHHIEAEMASTTSEVTKAADCENVGVTLYTAKFHKDAFETQTREVEIAALGHDWSEWTTVKEATETEEGEETRTCSRCGEKDTRPIPKQKHKHKMTLVPAVEATCTTSGHEAYYECSGCTAWYEDKEGTKQVTGKDILIPAKGHKKGTPVKGEETKPTCCQPGGYSLTTKCANCGAHLSTIYITVPIDSDAHDWGEATYAWADDNSTVTATRVCKNDPNHKETETVNVRTVITKAPTCEEKGIATYATEAFENKAFSVQTKKGEIAALGHNWGEVTYKWNKDSSSVTAKRVCRHDDTHIETETVDTTSEVANAPTCETKGETIYTAKFSNEAFEPQTNIVADIPALGHDWSAWTETKAATETEEGEEVRTCNRCGDTDTRPIPVIGHTHKLTLVPAVEATCTSSGHEAYYECSGCSAWFKDKKANTQVTGKDILIPAAGHQAGEPVKGEVMPATCSEPGGYTQMTYCEKCGAMLTVEHIMIPVDPDAHTWDKGVITIEPTETTEGRRVYTCEICGKTRIETIPSTKAIDIEKSKIVLTDAAFTYNGEVQKPTVKTIDGKEVAEGTDYIIEYPDDEAKDVGEYTIIVNGIGKYTGKAKATYRIDPKGTTLKKAKKMKRTRTSIKVKWKKQKTKMSQSRINGYQIQLATDKEFTKIAKTANVKGFKKAAKKVSKLKGKTRYYVQIRTFMNVDGKTFYSDWSKARKVKTK